MRDTATVPQITRAHVFVVRDGLILALHQSGPPRWWETPGGDAELGEDAVQAVIRETREETGLTIVSPDLLRTWSYRSARGNDVDAHAYAAFAPDGDVRLSREHRGYVWMSVEEYAERYCSEAIGRAAPQYAAFLAEMRENCRLLQEWLAKIELRVDARSGRSTA
jgi:ADP-ribose pyrophosphatase YjhB (NUDIX family)